jgi:hypothetical protein
MAIIEPLGKIQLDREPTMFRFFFQKKVLLAHFGPLRCTSPLKMCPNTVEDGRRSTSMDVGRNLPHCLDNIESPRRSTTIDGRRLYMWTQLKVQTFRSIVPISQNLGSLISHFSPSVQYTWLFYVQLFYDTIFINRLGPSPAQHNTKLSPQ